ncbi:MAG: FAD-binding protein, partial [Deltaproteobacteria bacterium]|nr:FAD-binding protein [Deltaproteobacteria bacterium]
MKDETMAQSVTQNDNWNLEADVVIIGSGAAGIPAAIKAVEAGASVIVVETNYDVGGHAILS